MTQNKDVAVGETSGIITSFSEVALSTVVPTIPKSLTDNQPPTSQYI